MHQLIAKLSSAPDALKFLKFHQVNVPGEQKQVIFKAYHAFDFA
jgi:hypothetical protein